MNDSFIKKIEARENEFHAALRNISSPGKNLYIFGFGFGARQVVFLLQKWNIDFAGYAVNRTYYYTAEKLFCIEDVLEKAEDHSVNLIIAFKGYHPDVFKNEQHKISKIIDMDCFAGMTHYDGEILFSFQWLQHHTDFLENFYSSLADDLSRRTLVAYCNQKISMNYKYLSGLQQKNQYFDSDIISFSEHEIFVDCGAYIGDSALAFIEALKKQKLNSYDRIISIEPCAENFEKMKKLELHGHQCLCEGVSNCKKRVYFCEEKDSSSVSRGDSGSCSIEVDTIDNILDGTSATIIKMDVEGEELHALQGAEKTIRKYKPVLAVCLYHKAEDLTTIPQYIHSLVPEYSFYLRSYERSATEMVLYAVLQGEKDELKR